MDVKKKLTRMAQNSLRPRERSPSRWFRDSKPKGTTTPLRWADLRGDFCTLLAQRLVKLGYHYPDVEDWLGCLSDEDVGAGIRWDYSTTWVRQLFSGTLDRRPYPEELIAIGCMLGLLYEPEFEAWMSRLWIPALPEGEGMRDTYKRMCSYLSRRQRLEGLAQFFHDLKTSMEDR